MDGYTYDSYYNARDRHEIAMRVILAGMCLVATGASLFLAITILRFKRLKTRPNIYIVHLSILNSLYNIGLFILLINDFKKDLELPLYITFYLIIMHVIFAFLLSLDWFLTATKPNWMTYFQKIYKYVFLVIYLILLVGIILTFTLMSPYEKFNVTIFIAVYFFIILLLILLNVLRGIITIKTEAVKTKYAFTIANVTLFSFMPCLFHHFVYLACIFYFHHGNFESFFYFITFLPYILWIGHPILVIYLLGYLNEHFKMAYHKSFRRSTNYSPDDLDELYQEQTEPDPNVNINFSNGQQKTVHI